jgi:hypothetical protein
MVFGVFVVVTSLVGCVSTRSNTPTNNPTPDDTGDDTGSPTNNPPADRPARIDVDFGYPDDWTPEPDPEHNLMRLRHTSGAIITFTIWPLEQGDASARIMEIWMRMSDAAEQGVPLEVGSPMRQSDGGTEASYLLATITDSSDQRFTLLWIAFASNYPGLGVMVTGAWPVSMNTEMFSAIQQISRSIRVVERPTD